MPEIRRESQTIPDLSFKEKRKALIRVSQFVLEEEAEKIRDDLQEKIVETALFWGTREGKFVSSDKIPELIEEEIRLVKFPKEMLDEIFSKLLKKGSIAEDEKGFYNLSVLRRTEFGRLVNKKKEEIERINEQFLFKLEREYGRRLTDEQKEEGLEKFYSFLASLTLEKSDLVARIITQKNLEDLPMELNIHILFRILGEIDKIGLRNAQFRAIKLIFREASDEFCSFLFSLTQNLICIQILNLDPECQALEKKAFSNKLLFLDTNVLIALVCPTDGLHRPATQLISLSNQLGASFSVTKITCEEYMAILEGAHRVFKNWKAPIKFLANADNEFLTSFWSEKQNNQSLSWRSYYQRTRDVGRILKEHNIQIYTENLDPIRKKEHFDTVKTQVNTCYLTTKGKGKAGIVCEHDALLMLLVRELRKKQSLTLFGPDYWFITGDESLLCVDNKINATPEFRDNTPSSMLCQVWLEMISPFLPLNIREKEAYEAFSMLIKHQFALVPFDINTETLVKIQGSWTKYEWLESEDIIKIQNQEWTKKYIRRLKKAQREKDVSKAEELGRAFAKKLEDGLRKIRDDKLKKLSREKTALNERQALLSSSIEEKMKMIADLEKLINSQKADLDQKRHVIQSKERELEKEAHFKRQLRTVSVIAGLFLVISPLILMVSKALPMTLEVVIFCVAALIVGAVLLYFGIAPERADVSVEAKLGISKS